MLKGLLASFWPKGSLDILWMISAEGLIHKLLARRESGHPVDGQCGRTYLFIYLFYFAIT